MTKTKPRQMLQQPSATTYSKKMRSDWFIEFIDKIY